MSAFTALLAELRQVTRGVVVPDLLRLSEDRLDAVYDEHRALLRRDWAVRVLDAWALINRNWPGPETVKCDYRKRGEWGCMVGFEDLRTSTRRKAHYGDSPAAARLAAAEAVWPELPESVRAEIGERP